MTDRKILLTSFDTWMPHQTSNASDDLLVKVAARFSFLADCLIFLRKLPVDDRVAPKRAIAKIKQVQPDAVICCGMAESRDRLTVESQAVYGQHCLKTSVNLPNLVADLTGTEISHNAGKFVCEALYYSVLNYLKKSNSAKPEIPCIFVHVPVLHPENIEAISADFWAIVQRLSYKPNLEANTIGDRDSSSRSPINNQIARNRVVT